MGYGRSCGCGEASKSSAVMSRTQSEYIMKDIPTVEIEQNISWLNEIKHDCDFKIGMLETLNKNRDRSKRHRKEVKALVEQFCATMILCI